MTSADAHDAAARDAGSCRTATLGNTLHFVSRLTDHEDFLALRPFFRIVEEALTGIVDGADFFDMLAEDIVVDYVITVPGYPRRVVGRDAVADLYRPYGTQLTLICRVVCHP